MRIIANNIQIIINNIDKYFPIVSLLFISFRTPFPSNIIGSLVLTPIGVKVLHLEIIGLPAVSLRLGQRQRAVGSARLFDAANIRTGGQNLA